METQRDRQFRDLVAQRRAYLLRTAKMLTAGDAHLAEDLVQAALTKVYVSWTAFSRADNPDAYLHRTLVNALTDERRRKWRRHEDSAAQLPEKPTTSTASESDDAELAVALRALPPRMRAAIVLRFVHELDVAETAAALGCSIGTVKSQTARGLDKLRTALTAGGRSWHDEVFLERGGYR